MIACIVLGACIGFIWGVFLCDLLNEKERELREKEKKDTFQQNKD